MASFTGDAIASPQLAASLLALGIAPLRGKFVVRTGEVPADQIILYRFEDSSACGQFKAREMIRAWPDPLWPEDNPRHPLAALISMWAAFRTTADDIRLARNVPPPVGALSVPDRLTSSALQSMRFALHASCPISRRDSTVYWHFLDTEPARRAVKLFRDVDQIAKAPTDVLSYLSAAAINWQRLVKNIKEASPFAVVSHCDRHIAVGINSSMRTQDRFGQLLEGKWKP